MRRPTLVLLVLLLLPVPAARAGGWDDVKRAFEEAMRSEAWSTREQAFLPLIDYDGAGAVEVILTSLATEENGLVVRTAVKTLGRLESEAARTALVAAAKKARPPLTDRIFMALGQQKGETGADLLIETLGSAKEPQQRAMAALALGEKGLERSLAPLVKALEHDDWHVVSAASRALAQIAWSAWTTPENPKEGKKPAKPAWFDDKQVVGPLAERLASATGAERGDLIHALEAITGKDHGWNVHAWRMVAKGQEPDAATLRKQQHPPYMFGVPLYGQRLVIVMDANVLTDNAVPFKTRERLQELCKVPGGRDVPWFKIKTVKEFNAAHVIRGIRDIPAKKHKFELIFSAIKPRPVFGKLVSANSGKRKQAIEEIEDMRPANQNDVLATMNRALDSGGAKDAQAWKKGPDEILCVYTSVPWLAPETDAGVIGSTIGLKARRRMVRVNAVGVREYAYEMMRLFAELSGGRYVALTE